MYNLKYYIFKSRVFLKVLLYMYGLYMLRVYKIDCIYFLGEEWFVWGRNRCIYISIDEMDMI